MKLLLLLGLALSVSFCAHKNYQAYESEEPTLHFLSFNTKHTADRVVDLADWKKFKPTERANIILNMEQISSDNEQKVMAYNKDLCFRGDADQVAKMFFEKANVSGYKDDVAVQIPNPTQHYLRLKFTPEAGGEDVRVKMVHCNQGRGSSLDRDAVAYDWDITKRIHSRRRPSQADAALPPVIPRDSEGNVNGYVLVDPLTSEQEAEMKRKRLKKWKGRFDFHNAKVDEKDFVWRAKNFDIKKYDDALKFALLMQKYVYEGFTKSRKHDNQFDPWKNEKRYWCHTPWLNPGVKGREAIHGLTREFPIEHSAAYPSYVRELSFFQRPTSWGGAYFNAPACSVYEEIFGTEGKSEKATPDWNESIYPDGTISFKMLFNSAVDKKGELIIPEVKNAYKWTTHTGILFSKREQRQLRKMYHIQMDISFKDSQLKGTNPDLKHWGMITYYYDKNYKGPSEYFGSEKVESPYDIKGLPTGLKKMRPVGVQFGMEPGESIIFKNSENNHVLAENEVGQWDENDTRLNGPADNPQSSCLSCHGASGHDIKIPPGVMTNQQYVDALTKSQGFDFNMQVDLAKKYFEETQAALKEEEK